ncbi:MAG TPA: carboxypeptidase-like regulatory domain-containing protein [Terriglobia bacterium]|nr:carboxypeptidase-like regulatory domain-containing protein [Terriglobia bacterium]
MTKKRVGKPGFLPKINPHGALLLTGRATRGAGAILTLWGLCVLMLSVFAPCAAAKQKPLPTKTVTGAVLDQSNHNVSGASVFLTDLRTRHTDAIYSGADGTYNFSGLNPNDDYQVQAKYRGLVSEIRSTSSFDTRPRVILNLVLGKPASLSPASSQPE